MTPAQGFGARVIQLMAERQATTGRKVTARSVAADLGIPEGSFSRYINREAPPGDDIISALSEYFGVMRGWLRYGEGEKSPPPSAPIAGGFKPHPPPEDPPGEAKTKPKKKRPA